MNLADVNIWLALTLSRHHFHDTVTRWFRAQPDNGNVMLCRATQQSFLRLLTNQSVLKLYGIPSMSNADAWQVLEQLADDPRVAWAAEPPGIERIWKSLTVRHTPSTQMWMDAYLAAFAIAGNHKMITTDKGFARYPGLDLELLKPGS